MMDRCYKCRGQRQYMGAGMITHKCDVCLGTGHLTKAAPIVEVELAEEIAEELPKPKRKYNRKDNVLRGT